MGCRTEKFGAAALLFTFLIETTNGNKSAISRKGDGYGIGTGNKIP